MKTHLSSWKKYGNTDLNIYWNYFRDINGSKIGFIVNSIDSVINNSNDARWKISTIGPSDLVKSIEYTYINLYGDDFFNYELLSVAQSNLDIIIEKICKLYLFT